MSHDPHSGRILIVDDDPQIAQVLSFSLQEMGEGYTCEVARSGPEALSKIQQAPYELLITDYHLPGMSGLELTQAVRQISPDTQVVLMTAYDTDTLRNTIKDMRFDGYIDKPFTVQEIHEIVKGVVARTSKRPLKKHSPYSGKHKLDKTIQESLTSLRVHTGAHCVLLIHSSGYPISVVGPAEGLDISAIGALVAANFLASVELANLLGSHNSVFKSSYHEGNDYNIYSYDINGDLLLAVIFGSGSKPGVVWFYTKQTATKLASLAINQSWSQITFDDDNLRAVLDVEFDKLFEDVQEEKDRHHGLSSPGGQAVSTTPDAKRNTASNDEQANDQKPDPAKAMTRNSVPKQKADQTDAKPMTFEQAVGAGLVPPQIVQREQDQPTTSPYEFRLSNQNQIRKRL